MSTFLLPMSPIQRVEDYVAGGVGGRGIECAVELGPAGTREAVRRSGLRGRGGGGFPTGRKWESIATDGDGVRYVVCNAAEGEPGTFKDRALLRANPYQLVEGVVIAAYAVGASQAFICLKTRFEEERARVTRAVQELQDAGICSECEITIVAGPDEYLYGEEKAMLEVVEGGAPLPRLYPPHEQGLFTRPGGPPNPTLVNNAETLSNVPHILARGHEWFRSMGTAESPGTIVTTVVGDVVAPDVGEVELGTPLGAVIDAVGSGVAPGRSVKAVLSGVANPVLTADALGAPVSYEGLQAAGGGMGSAGFIVLDDTACMVQAAMICSRFLFVESCGQCPPCKTGSGEITRLLERIEGGAGASDDIDVIASWLERVTDGNRCFLAVEERTVVSSLLQTFAAELAEHVDTGRCPRPRQLPIWSLLDLRDGVATYDEKLWRKRPDWTYDPA